MILYPPVYQACDVPTVRAFLGTPMRLYSFGDAGDGPIAKPYVLWQTVSGEPINYLGNRPDVDRYQVTLEIVSDNPTQARQLQGALFEAIEGVAHVTGLNGEFRDPETKDYRISFDVDFWVHR